MKCWLAPLIVGAFWLMVLLIGMAGATVHTIICTYPPPCVECADIATDCRDTHPCLFDDATSWTGWASHETLCPPSAHPGWRACMFQFADSATGGRARSLFAWDCTCDGHAFPCDVEAGDSLLLKVRRSWWCVTSWLPGCP